MSKPNVVLIFVDNQPANMLGCSGNDEIYTPNLDALALEGVRFSNAFCPNTMCSPCRASVLTGLMPSQHGIHSWLDDSEISNWPKNWNAIGEFRSLSEMLSENGYKTALVGKYHLGIADQPQNGFQYWVTFQIGHVQSFYNNKMIDNGEQYTYPGHSVEFFTQRAVDYLEEASRSPDQPFFLFLTYPAPYGHWPSVKGEPENKFAERYTNTPFNSVSREGISDELIDWILIRKEKFGDLSFQGFRDLIRIPNDLPTLRNYYSQMSMVDEGVGQVLAALDNNNQSDNTMVIYTSDHGMSLGEHGFWGHGKDTWPSNTYKESNHIPLLVRPPGQRSGGRTASNLVGTTDIFATIMDYVNLEFPGSHNIPARSLRKIIEGHDPQWEQEVFMEQEETRSVRTDEWLFMKRFDGSDYDFNSELYNLIDDSDERNNLIESPDHAAIIKSLSEKVDNFFDTYSAPQWNLWQGGSAKSNSSRSFLWKEVWGVNWRTQF